MKGLKCNKKSEDRFTLLANPNKAHIFSRAAGQCLAHRTAFFKRRAPLFSIQLIWEQSGLVQQQWQTSVKLTTHQKGHRVTRAAGRLYDLEFSSWLNAKTCRRPLRCYQFSMRSSRNSTPPRRTTKYRSHLSRGVASVTWLLQFRRVNVSRMECLPNGALLVCSNLID